MNSSCYIDFQKPDFLTWLKKKQVRQIICGIKFISILQNLTYLFESHRKSLQHLQKILLCRRNLTKAINTGDVAFERFPALFLKGTGKEFRQIDQRTRKSTTIYKVLHLRGDIKRLYVLRKEEGRGLASIEDSEATSIRGRLD